MATRAGPVPRHLCARPAVVAIIGAFALSPISTPGFDHSRFELDEAAAQFHRDGPQFLDYSEGGPPEKLASMFEGYEIEELGEGWYRFYGWL